MAEITFVTANKNYCLWPLPAWLCLKVAGIEFDEITIPFSDPNARERFQRHTPTGSSCDAVPLVTVAPENNLTSL